MNSEGTSAGALGANIWMSMESLSGLLLFLLTLHSVNSLKCYVCSSASSNEHCNRNSDECQAPHDTCMTTVDIAGKVQAIVKQCASARTCAGAADKASLDVNGDGNVVKCCRSHLCNYSAATSIQMYIWLLLPLCLLTILINQNGA